MSVRDLTYTNDVCRLVLSKPLSAATTGVAITSGTPSSLTPASPSYWLDLTNKSLPSDFTFTRNTVATYYDANGYVKTAAINEPRFHHNPETKECLGVLIERAVTNSISDNRMTGVATDPFTVGVGGISKAYASGQVTPAGVVEPNLIFRMAPSNLSNVIKYMLRAETWAVQANIFSAFFKLTNSATPIYPCLIMDDSINGGCFARFDLVNGTVVQGQSTGSGTYIDAGIEKLPNGWARCWLAGSAASGSNGRAAITIRNNTNSSNGYDPAWTATNTTDGVYVLWPQIEKTNNVPRPTSVIITNGSFVTRGIESLSAPTSPWINQNEGTVLIDYYRFHSNVSYGTGYIFSLSSTSVDYINSFDNLNNNVLTRTFINGEQQAGSITTSTNQINGRNMLAVSYKRGVTVAQALNGAFNSSSGAHYPTALPTLSTLTLGSDYANNFALAHSCIARLRYYPVALSNPELTSLSAIQNL